MNLNIESWLSFTALICLINGYLAQSDGIQFPNEDGSIDLPEVISKKELTREPDGYCTYEEIKKKIVSVKVPYTETERFYGRCPGYYFKKCINERRTPKERVEQRIQEVTSIVRACCDGYAESTTSSNRCLPICEPGCVYGNCTLPNTCTCYSGYKTNEHKPNECEPACVGCTNGKCLAPNVCYCNSGYDWDSNNVECVPVCSGNCENGKCAAPEKCDCDEGFVHHHTHSICIPHCEKPCVHGVCIEPDKCECDFGYKFVNESQNICEPHCELSCKNAKCVAPNECECHDGYTILDDDKPHECHCGQYCVEIDGICHCLDEDQRVNGDRIRNNISSICTESNCQNGFCSTPNECECYVGFEKNDNNICVAVNETCIDDPTNCEGPEHVCTCINGICSNNHTCICVNGFKMTEGRNDICEPFCSKECVNGFCINPDSCECHTGYRLGYNESQSHICHPICDPDAEDNNGCINGICVKPDICECNEGFELDLNVNYTCILSPFNAAAQKSGMNWGLTGIIILIISITSLAAATLFVYRRRRRQFNVPKCDEASEPITAYLHEEM